MIAKVFVDTDVLISSLLSQTGAAFQLLHNTNIQRCVSNLSIEESQKTAEKLGIDSKKLQKRFDMCTQIIIDMDLEAIKKEFETYVNDMTDSHVVAGAAKSQARFLITYNLKDFKVELIKRELDTIVLTPGTFLQYLRSRK